MEARTAGVTVRVVEAVIVPKLAEMEVVPTAKVWATPAEPTEVPMVATAGADEVQ